MLFIIQDKFIRIFVEMKKLCRPLILILRNLCSTYRVTCVGSVHPTWYRYNEAQVTHIFEPLLDAFPKTCYCACLLTYLFLFSSYKKTTGIFHIEVV